MGAGASDSEDEGKGVLKGGTEGATVTWLLQWVVTTAAQLGADMEALETTVCRLLLSSASPEVRGCGAPQLPTSSRMCSALCFVATSNFQVGETLDAAKH